MTLVGLRDRLLNGGLGEEAYRNLASDIKEENRKNLASYSSVAAVMFAVLTVVSVITDTFASVNAAAYGSCFLLCAVIWLMLRKTPDAVLVRSGALDYVFCLVLYGFSLCVTLLHPEFPAVTAIVVLPIIPLLFTKKPLHLAVMTILVVAVFCVLVVAVKNSSIAATDVWNAISFGALGIIVSFFIVNMRIRSFAQASRIQYLSNYDTLTNLKNRNCYEQELGELAALAKVSFGCVYADANGLHELNNTCGHARGDALLQCVASALKDAFGENTYRVGGDEFVALVVDRDEEGVRKCLVEMLDRVESQGFSSSYGYACIPAASSTDLDVITKMVEDAEADMFDCKAEHYKRSGKDRRVRS